MLDSATIDGLKALRLHAMAAALADQQAQAGYAGLSFDERLGLLVDRELTDRASRRIERSLKTARLRAPATIEDIWSPGIFVDIFIMLLLVPDCQIAARNPLGLSCRADVVSGRDCNIARCSRTRRS